jgi:hypothetical protein
MACSASGETAAIMSACAAPGLRRHKAISKHCVRVWRDTARDNKAGIGRQADRQAPTQSYDIHGGAPGNTSYYTRREEGERGRTLACLPSASASRNVSREFR